MAHLTQTEIEDLIQQQGVALEQEDYDLAQQIEDKLNSVNY